MGNIRIGDHVLDEINELKNLGVIFKNDLSFTNHITGVVTTARQRLFLLHKCFLTKDPKILIRAFKTYVLPILDYCSQIWSPHRSRDIDRLESVQRMFTKRLRGYQNLSYSARLTKAGLSSLELRRVRADLVLCFKMLHCLIDLSNSAQLFVVDKNSRTRGHC